MTRIIRRNCAPLTGVVISVTLLCGCGAGTKSNSVLSEQPDVGQAVDAADNQTSESPSTAAPETPVAPIASLPDAESSQAPGAPDSPAVSTDSAPLPGPTPESEDSPPINVSCTATASEIQNSSLNLINNARATARSCGDIFFEAANPLTWNSKLADAAITHSNDMALHNFFSHTGSDGSNVSLRADAQAYNWRAVGENIAAGQISTVQVVDGWLESPSHCKNLMDSKFTEVAVACVENDDSDYNLYWTNVLGTSF